MIYFIRDPMSARVKIGFSEAPWARFSQLQTGSSADLVFAAVMAGDKAAERELHRRFAEYWVRGEWFAEIGQLAAFVSALPAPIKESARSLRPAKSPLDAWMIANGVRNQDLARRFGYSQPFISRLRIGDRQPTLDLAVELMELTGLSARDFVVVLPTRMVRKRAA